MKKIIALFLALLTVFSLSACSSTEYEAQQSTEEESRVVYTLTVGNKSYDVRYELYRALFLSYRDEVTGGNEGAFSGDDAEYYKNRINSLVLDRIASIYAVFAVCKDIGYDLYSSEVDKRVNEYIKDSIEGEGGYGSYEAYLDALSEMNLNWSCQDLLLRYGIGLAAIDEYYIGDFDADNIGDTVNVGKLKYSREDVLNYYNSDACVRVLRAHIQAKAHYDPDEYAERVRGNMLAAGSESAVAAVIINTGLTAPTEVMNGYVMGRHNLDNLYYGELTEAAFELRVGEVSPAVRVHNGEDDIIFILYRGEKSEEHFNKCYSEIAYVYLTDTVGAKIDEAAEGLKSEVRYTDVYNTLDLSLVK